ncbi:MAG: AAA family ATPase [Anaerolineae bacterium]|nr:AAA family ATPase [Anaerolineae bacterium]
MIELIGHDWAVRHLQAALVSGQLAQSHLFVGPPSIGKSTLARALAAELLGQTERARALAMQGKHPDLLWVEPQEGGSIKVEALREVLRALMLSPVEGKVRVAVIQDAHQMTDSSQNALLKTLEEPNPSTVVILVAPSTEALLPTIVSRCQVLNLRPVPTKVIEQALVARGAEPSQAHVIARLSRGRVGWALRALSNPDVLTARQQCLEALRALLSANRSQRLAYAEKLARADATELQDTLMTWALFWRDVARVASGASGEPIHLDLADWLSDLAQHLSPTTLLATIRATMKALRQIDVNVNTRLALDVLVLQLPRL